jgi:type III secretion protein D
MKQLRILTGLHAGVQLRLTRRQYRIASDEDADLQISDWAHAPLILTFEEEGSDVSPALHLIADDGTPARTTAGALGLLEDFLPRRFGDIVLCAGPDAGPDAAAWPSDMALMDALMRPVAKIKATAAVVAQAAPRAKTALGLKLSALVAAAALIAGLASVLSTQTAASTTPPASPMEQVMVALRQAGVEGLTVRRIDRRLVVEGLLPGSAEMARARAALQPFGEGQLLHRYASASDIVRQIGDALNRPGVRVVHRGQGVFAVEGQAADPAELQDEVRRIAGDIGPLVRRIDVAVEQTLPTARVRVGSMLAGDDGLQYVQTADGTKHLSLRTPVDDGAAVAGDPSSSSPTGEP